jgi:hypothetical protein
MKSLRHRGLFCAFALTAALSAAVAQDFTVNQGNIIKLVLDQTVSSKTNKAGDRVQTHCDEGDCGGFPKGTKFFAIIEEITPRTEKEPGRLKIKFATAVLPDKTKVAIEAEPYSGAESKGGTQTKKGNKALSTGIGALGGVILFKNDTAGALIGGATGYALGKKKQTITNDIEIQQGTRFQIRMLKTVTVKRSAKARK